MALGEGTALSVLAGEAHRMPLPQQCAECQSFGSSPVDVVPADNRFASVLQKPSNSPMRVKALGNRGDPLTDLLEDPERCPGLAAAGIVEVARRLDLRPAPIKPIRAVGPIAGACFELDVEFGAPFCAHLLDLFGRDDVLADELLAVVFARRRMIADGFVHQWLRERWLVAFVVPVAAIAEHVDNDGMLEFLPELGAHFRGKSHRLWVVA